MELKTFTVTDLQGNVIPNPLGYLYQPGTTTLVPVFDATGAALTNPFPGNINGELVFAAADGDYDLRVVGGSLDRIRRVRFINLREDLASSDTAKGGDLVAFDSDRTVSDMLRDAEKLGGDFELKTLSGYEGVNTDTQGPYPVDAIEENKAVFRGGFREVNSLRKVDGPILADVVIDFVDYRCSPARPVALYKTGTYTVNLPIGGIEASLPDSVIAYTPFARTNAYDIGSPSFVYKGDRPVNCNISGCIKIMVNIDPYYTQEMRRTAGISPEQTPTCWLRLYRDSGPAITGTTDALLLAVNLSDHKKSPFKIGRGAVREIPLPAATDFTAFEALRAQFPTWFELCSYTDELSTMSANSISETLIPDQAARTTSWIPRNLYTSFYMVSSTTRERRRFQFKDKSGKIHYDSLESYTLLSETVYVYTPPPEAEYFRVHYSRPNIVPAGDFKIYGLSPTVDARCGDWIVYDLSFNGLFTFEPESTYSFRMSFYDGTRVITPSGFVLQHGSAKFQLNVRDHLQKKYEEMSND